MTAEQRDAITRMRVEGQGYTTIARTIGLSKETVKTFCQRNNLGAKLLRTEREDGSSCPNCGKKIEQKTGCKPRRFCSSKCRQFWWNSHQDRVGKKAIYNFICPGCGRSFISYGNRHRKYCSHSCYIKVRFRGGVSGDDGTV